MKIKNILKSLLAAVALSFTACEVQDNALQYYSVDVVSVSPTDAADGIWVKPISWLPTWNVSFTVTFADDVVIAQEKPEGISLVNVYSGQAIEEKQFEETQWVIKAGEDAKSVEVRLENEEGSLIGVVLADEAYKLTIPAGVISDINGNASNTEVTAVVYSSKVAKEREGVPTALAVASVQPADTDADNIWSKPISWLTTWNVEFVVTFSEDVVIKNDKPEGISLVNTYNGKAIEQKQFEETHWAVKAGSDAKSVVVRLENEDGSLIAVKLEDEAYKLTIPAGIVANVAGNVENGVITKTVYSSQAAVENNGRPSALTLVSALPEPDSYDEEANLWIKANPFATTWNINFVLTFEEDVVVATEKPEGVSLVKTPGNEDIITLKSLADFGAVNWVAEAIEGNSKAIRIRLADADFGGTKAAKLEDEAFKLTVPAGVVKSADGAIANKEITATFYSSEAAKEIK